MTTSTPTETTEPQTGPEPAEDTADVGATAVRRTRRKLVLRWMGMPALLALAFGALYLWVSGQELDSIEKRTLNASALTQRVIEHLQLAAVSTLIVIVIAIPLGILATRRSARYVAPVLLALGNLGQAIPSFGLITIVVLLAGVGFKSVVFGLVAYSALPILRNTMVGLQQVDQTLVKSARGMGMSPMKTLLRVELPLAVPVVLAGVRTALILNVGTATLATFFGVKALGYVIFQGIQLDRTPVLIVGAVMASGLALLVDYLAGVVEELLTPRGL
ncbi:ABC transporter permease [Mangrovihabitans endophyticus]|uniref:Permease n=1 Tax=Mangrovihabitans endophyticus TaxID=1751298 RepID=A0A8J3FMM7_9ACTN|nr:ABC transporter permease [Mangrovihabitans endophyticus]GGK74451.1 permease [Mangrovihabitans endophyticus]